MYLPAGVQADAIRATELRVLSDLAVALSKLCSAKGNLLFQTVIQFVSYVLYKSSRLLRRTRCVSSRSSSVPPLSAKPTPETQGGTKEGEGAKGAFRQLVGLKGEPSHGSYGCQTGRLCSRVVRSSAFFLCNKR